MAEMKWCSRGLIDGAVQGLGCVWCPISRAAVGVGVGVQKSVCAGNVVLLVFACGFWGDGLLQQTFACVSIMEHGLFSHKPSSCIAMTELWWWPCICCS
jgi:hypothetical protein